MFSSNFELLAYVSKAYGHKKIMSTCRHVQTQLSCLDIMASDAVIFKNLIFQNSQCHLIFVSDSTISLKSQLTLLLGTFFGVK